MTLPAFAQGIAIGIGMVVGLVVAGAGVLVAIELAGRFIAWVNRK